MGATGVSYFSLGRGLACVLTDSMLATCAFIFRVRLGTQGG